MNMDTTRDFILCQIKETLEVNDLLDLSSLTNRILLYNSLISLIVLPVEEIKRSGTAKEKNRLYKRSLSDLLDSCSFSLEIFEPISGFDKETQRLKFNKKDMYAFMKKLRNAIAHQNVRFHEEDGCTRIIFSNLYASSVQPSKEIKEELKRHGLEPKGKGVEDFRISISFEELKKLSDWIGSEYLRTLEFKSNRQVGNDHEQN